MNKTITFTTPAFLQRTKELLKTVVGRAAHRKATAHPTSSAEWKRQMLETVPNPLIADLKDTRPGFLYDTLTGAAGAAVPASLPFFTTPQSASKAAALTNLVLPGQLQNPQTFLVMAIRCVFLSMFGPDIESMILNYYLKLTIGLKPYTEGTFDMFPGGAGVSGMIAGTFAAPGAASFNNNGLADPRAINNWGADAGILIGYTEVFKFEATSITAPTLAASSAAVGGFAPQGRGYNVRSVFDGMHSVQVQ